MSDTAQVIELLTDTLGCSIHNEALSDAGSAIVAGMLVAESGGKVAEHGTAGANAQRLFALSNLATGGTIDDAYAVGETVRYGAFHVGQPVFSFVDAGASAIVEGDALESDGNGNLRKQVVSASTAETARDSVVGYAMEAVDNSGGGSSVRIKIRVA